jgi:hexokinase
VAASLFALWELKAETETSLLEAASKPMTATDGPLEGGKRPFLEATRCELDISRSRTLVAFNGSVIEHYPGYRTACQEFIRGLLASSSCGAGPDKPPPSIELVAAKESSLLGAAVALACLDEEKIP